MECRRPRSEASCDQDEVRRSRVRRDRSGRPRCASSLRKGTSGLALAGQSRHVSKVLPCVDTSRYAHRVSPMSCRAEITSLLAESSGDGVSRGLGFGSLRDVSVPGRAFVHFRKTPYLSRPLQDSHSRCTNARPGPVTDVASRELHVLTIAADRRTFKRPQKQKASADEPSSTVLASSCASAAGSCRRCSQTPACNSPHLHRSRT